MLSPEHIILVLKTHLGAGDTSAFVVPSAAIAQLSTLFDIRCQYSSYEGPPKILTTQQ